MSAEQHDRLLRSVAPVLQVMGRSVDEVTDVAPLLGRNISGSLTFDDGITVFAKKVTGLGAADRHRRSVSFAEAVEVSADDPLFATPDLLASDTASAGLVYQYVPDVSSAGGLMRDDELDIDALRGMGTCVGRLHNLPLRSADAAEAGLPFFPPHGPNAITDSVYYGSTIGQLEMWRIIQSDDELRAGLDTLVRAGWPSATPIHGDMRGDQIFLAGEQTWIFDWEDFRLGDPARDVGALLGEVFYHRMRSAMATFAGTTEDITDRDVIERGTEALELAAPNAAAVWAGYGDADSAGRQREDSSTPDGFVARCVGFFGWQLFDRALAAGTYYGRLSALDRAIAGIGRQAILGGVQYAETLGLTQEVAA